MQLWLQATPSRLQQKIRALHFILHWQVIRGYAKSLGVWPPVWALSGRESCRSLCHCFCIKLGGGARSLQSLTATRTKRRHSFFSWDALNSSLVRALFFLIVTSLLLKNMACRLFLAVLLSTVLLIWGMQVARSEVGVFSPSGKSLNESNTLGPQSWYLGPDGCRLGRPGNLVVTPSKGFSLNGGELLDTTSTGPRLCNWLAAMEKAHDSMRPTWEREHASQRAQVQWWNLPRRLRLWRRAFPEFKVEVLVRYLDLWNNDRFGHAMPWIAAHFVYDCPDPESSYGLMEHLCNTAFSQQSDSRVPETVYILLQPREGYNQPLKVEADKWQYVTGLTAGLRPGRTPLEKRQDEWAWASALYARAASFMTINGSIDDCWMNKGYCYFKS